MQDCSMPIRLIRSESLSSALPMLDCASDEPESCRVIGQEDERINVGIPPGQARDVSRTISFDNAAATGALKWEFKVTSTRS